MREDEINLLDIQRGLVVAPAGCGKTHLIVETLKRHSCGKPTLVLTHTNAGVAALRGRLDRGGVLPSAYRLATIDGWAIRIISTFPKQAGLDPNLLNLANPRADYPSIRDAALSLLKAGHINDVLAASYAHLLVDEYQDCSRRQHAMVHYAAQTLPTCVLGDPLQAIFNFGSDGLAKWDEDVCKCFSVAGQLITPWRWILSGAEPLGRWLLDVREELLAKRPIDLREAPDGVKWIELDGTSDHEKLLKAARIRAPNDKDRVLIIGDSMSAESRHKIASSTAGAIAVEAVDLRDLVSFGRNLVLTASDALQRIADFAQSVMSNVGAADLLRRVESLRKGTARGAITNVERIAVAFVHQPSHKRILDLLVEIGNKAGVRTFRPAVVRACIRALRICDENPGMSFLDAVMRVREQNRLQGRALPKRAVGSTLLLKGLEAEVAIILNAGDLDRRNLYVAMTRGSKMLCLCAPSMILKPAA
jgi:superfamily I DNA/RNA helicase